jgi:hypothetical protein
LTLGPYLESSPGGCLAPISGLTFLSWLTLIYSFITCTFSPGNWAKIQMEHSLVEKEKKKEKKKEKERASLLSL